jgi:hypothetical protein
MQSCSMRTFGLQQALSHSLPFTPCLGRFSRLYVLCCHSDTAAALLCAGLLLWTVAVAQSKGLTSGCLLLGRTKERH